MVSIVRVGVAGRKMVIVSIIGCASFEGNLTGCVSGMSASGSPVIVAERGTGPTMLVDLRRFGSCRRALRLLGDPAGTGHLEHSVTSTGTNHLVRRSVGASSTLLAYSSRIST